MRSNDILTVRVDLENGEYVLSRYDGQQSLVKPINDGERKSYDKKYIAERRKQIIRRNVRVCRGHAGRQQRVLTSTKRTK